MRSRSTTTCRRTGLARLGLAAAGLAVAGLAAPATAQEDEPTYPPLEWVATESLDAHPNADDQAVDIGYWKESFTKEWVFAAGWVTELDEEDEVVGTRIAVYKYDATDEGPGEPSWEARAFYPPLNVDLEAGDSYKAVAMEVDYLYGTVYVLAEGPSQPGGTDQDYILIRYDDDLVPVWTGGDGARFYDGPAGGDDIPADLGVQYGPFGIAYIVVTGSSPGTTTGLDIATIAWRADGDREEDLWPDVGWGDGVRRYDLSGNDDTGVEVGAIQVAETQPNNEPVLYATILGTAWKDSIEKNNYTVHLWSAANSPVWDVQYDNGANDVATGMTDLGGKFYITGYSEQPGGSFGPGGPALDIDYATLSYSYDLTSATFRWEKRLDYGTHDLARDIAVSVPSSGDNTVWVTGGAGDGTNFDVLSVRYLDNHTSGVVDEWSDGWAVGNAARYGRSVALLGTTPEPWDSGKEPYIVGSMVGSTSDRMLALKYESVSGTPPFEEDWYKTYYGSGAYTGGVNHEGRRAVVRSIGGDVITFIAGVSNESGEGKQFTVWRYAE